MKKLRHKKRILSAVLAGLLAVAMSLTAFAAPGDGDNSTDDANKGSITIKSAQKGVTYKAYKIFEVSYVTSGGAKSYSYTIEKDSKWLTTVQGYANVAANGMTLSLAADGSAYVVSTVEGTFSAANFAKALQEAVSDEITAQAEKEATDNGDLLLGDNLPLGYYLVMGKNPGLCSLKTTAPDAEVRDKNDVPFDKKLTAVAPGEGEDSTDITPVDSEGVTVGSVLTYTITGKVPDTEGFDEYVYIAEDTMDAGLTFNAASLTVKVGTNTVTPDEVTAETDMAAGKIFYKSATETSGGGFILRLDMTKYTTGLDVEITYTATVNENAVEKISKNEAKLKYGNDPEHLTDGTPSVVRVFSSSIEVLKHKNAAENDVLAGAEFVLENSIEKDGSTVPGGKYYKATFTGTAPNEKVTKVEWVDNIDDATKRTTGTDGKALFQGLENGTYYLVETKAPDGYNLLGANDAQGDKITDEGKVKVVVNTSLTQNGTEWTADPADYTFHEKVANTAGSLLPSTGGIGTTIFYVVGSVLLVLAAAWFVISRRRTQAEEK